MKVYVAGPYEKGDIAINVRHAVGVADELRDRGHVPFVPHLSHLWHLISSHSRSFWLDYDAEWLLECDCVFRIPGESEGADWECELAGKHGIPVFTRYNEVDQYRKEK